MWPKNVAAVFNRHAKYMEKEKGLAVKNRRHGSIAMATI